MPKLGFADAVRAHGDEWRINLECEYLRKGMRSNFWAVLLSGDGPTQDQLDAGQMRRLIETSVRSKT